MFPFIPFRHIPRRGRASLPGRRDESGSGGRHHPRQRAARCRWLQGPTSYCTPSIIFRNSAGKKTEGRLRVSPRRTRPGPGGRGRAQPLRLGARLLADALHKTGPREAGRNLAPPRPAPPPRRRTPAWARSSGGYRPRAPVPARARPSPSKSMRPSLFLSPSFIRDSSSSSVTCSPEARKISASSSASM